MYFSIFYVKCDFSALSLKNKQFLVIHIPHTVLPWVIVRAPSSLAPSWIAVQ